MSQGTQDPVNRQEPPGPEGAVGNTKRTRLWKRSIGVAALVAVLVVGGSATARGSTGPSVSGAGPGTPSTASTLSGTGPTDPPANLHGVFSVVNRDRSVQTRQWQWGEVVAMDEMTFTVRSADGFSGSYLIGPGVSVTGIGVGDTITVVGAGQATSADV